MNCHLEQGLMEDKPTGASAPPTSADDERPVALSIAGSDSGGGAGIQADLLAMTANGAFGTTAITCLTAQNPNSVSAIEPLPPAFIQEQIRQVDRYFDVRAIKTGMLFSREIIEAVAEVLGQLLSRAHRPALVVDPVMVATSGAILLSPDTIDTLTESLLPHATVITPNLDEAAVWLERRPTTREEMHEAALRLSDRFGTSVLLKGGHLVASDRVTDILAIPGKAALSFHSTRIQNMNTHGSGCSLASALAAHLAQGKELTAATQAALEYVRTRMASPVSVCGERFIRHY